MDGVSLSDLMTSVSVAGVGAAIVASGALMMGPRVVRWGVRTIMGMWR